MLILFFRVDVFETLKRKSEKTKIARPKINKQKCPPCGRTSNYRKSWAPRPQQLETPRLQKKHCHQLWYSLLPGSDTCLVSAPAQNCVTHVEFFPRDAIEVQSEKTKRKINRKNRKEGKICFSLTVGATIGFCWGILENPAGDLKICARPVPGRSVRGRI